MENKEQELREALRKLYVLAAIRGFRLDWPEMQEAAKLLPSDVLGQHRT